MTANQDKVTPPQKAQVDIHVKISEALAKMGVCIRNVGLYGRAHPLISEVLSPAHQILMELLSIQPNVTVAAGDSYLAVDSFIMEDSLGCLSSLAKIMHDRDIGELRLSPGVTEEEMLEFAEVLSMSPQDLILRGGAIVELRRRNVVHMQTFPPTVPDSVREGKDPADIYEEALLLVEEAMRALQSGLQIPVTEIRNVVSDSLQSLIADESALVALAGVRSYDRYLSEHSVNVCILSMVLGKDLGLEVTSNLEVGIASMLHDVGKVFIPGEIVRKPGKLSEEEWQEIRRHPIEGARALAGLPDLPALASTIALEHHVYCDGTGYPALPSDRKPHLVSRMVAIIDTYDALTTERPYRERWTSQKAIAWMLYESRSRYDTQLLARFASRAGLYPPGSLVKLMSGDLAVVLQGTFESPCKPSVKIIAGPGMKKVEPRVIDLASNTDAEFEIDLMAQPVEALIPYTGKLIAA